jgi:hypothetical protein
VRVKIRLGPHSSLSGLVGEPEAQSSVDVGFVVGVGVGDRLPNSAQALDECLDFIFGHWSLRGDGV